MKDVFAAEKNKPTLFGDNNLLAILLQYVKKKKEVCQTLTLEHY